MTKGDIKAPKFENYNLVTTITNWFMYVYTIHVGPFTRRNHTRFSNSQAMVLQKCFAKNAYPKKATVRMLCQQLRLSESRVLVWFKNQRRKVNARCGMYNETSSTGEDFIFTCTHLYCTYQL